MADNTARFEHKAISQAATTGTLVSGIAGKILEIWEIFIWNVTEQTLHLYDEQRSLTGPLTTFPEKSGFSLPYTGAPHFELNPGGSLKLTASGGTQVSGYVLFRLRQ